MSKFMAILKEQVNKKIDELADQQNFHQYETPLKSANQLRKEFCSNLHQIADPDVIVKKNLQTIALIRDSIQLVSTPEETEQVQKEIENSSKVFKQHLQTYIDQGTLPEEDISIQQILGISDESLLLMYKLVSYYFEHQDFNKAEQILYYLVYLAPEISNFWIVLALCCQKKNKISEAIAFFEVAEIINEENPAAYIYRINFLLEIKEVDQAKDTFAKLEKMVSDRPKLQKEWRPQIDALRRKF